MLTHRVIETRGSPGAPPSATATRTDWRCMVISTANQPPCPLAVCRTAFVPSSVAT